MQPLGRRGVGAGERVDFRLGERRAEGLPRRRASCSRRAGSCRSAPRRSGRRRRCRCTARRFPARSARPPAEPLSISSPAAPVSVQPRSVSPLNVRNRPAMPAAGPVSERACALLISGGSTIARAAAARGGERRLRRRWDRWPAGRLRPAARRSSRRPSRARRRSRPGAGRGLTATRSSRWRRSAAGVLALLGAAAAGEQSGAPATPPAVSNSAARRSALSGVFEVVLLTIGELPRTPRAEHPAASVRA